MMAADGFEYRVDEPGRLIHIVQSGTYGSRYYTDLLLEANAGVADIWRYDRLLDARKRQTLVDHDDLKRLSDQWIIQSFGHDIIARMALLSWNTVTHFRASSLDQMFPKMQMRSFTDVSEAYDWLASPRG